jgi:hypothetical protein
MQVRHSEQRSCYAALLCRSPPQLRPLPVRLQVLFDAAPGVKQDSQPHRSDLVSTLDHPLQLRDQLRYGLAS